MVRTRTNSEKSKHDEASAQPASAPRQEPVGAEAGVTASENYVEKCVNCQYYDRRRARPTDGKAPLWGQCRKHSPHLNPVTAKAYVVEGVWPLVRDDDWCGEWRVLTRIAEDPLPETPALPSEEASAAALASAPAPVPASAPTSPPVRGRPLPTPPADTLAPAGDD